MGCIHSFFKSAGSPTFLYGLLSGDNIIVIIMKVACSVICVVYSVYKMVWLVMFIATEESENNRKDCVKVSNRFFVMMIFLLVCLSCPCCCCVFVLKRMGLANHTCHYTFYSMCVLIYKKGLLER